MSPCKPTAATGSGLGGGGPAREREPSQTSPDFLAPPASAADDAATPNAVLSSTGTSS